MLGSHPVGAFIGQTHPCVDAEHSQLLLPALLINLNTMYWKVSTSLPWCTAQPLLGSERCHSIPRALLFSCPSPYSQWCSVSNLNSITDVASRCLPIIPSYHGQLTLSLPHKGFNLAYHPLAHLATLTMMSHKPWLQSAQQASHPSLERCIPSSLHRCSISF